MNPITRFLLAAREAERWGRIVQDSGNTPERDAARRREFNRALAELRSAIEDMEDL